MNNTIPQPITEQISGSEPLSMPHYGDMLKSGMHFGRKRTIFHPNMKPYVYGVRENIYILDLVKTSLLLSKALDFLKHSISQGKVILFVGTSKQSSQSIKETAQQLKMPYVVNRWLGGTLTNFRVIIERVKYLHKLEAERDSGDFDKYTKKERVTKQRQIEKLIEKYDGLRTLIKLPDVVFVSSTKESQLPIREANRLGIPIVGIINTDSDPDDLTHPIPANDNARKSVELILTTLKANL